MSAPAPERKSQGRTGESGAAGTKVPHVYTNAKRSHTRVKDPVVHVRVRWTIKTSKITQHAQRSVRAFTVLKLDTIQKKKNLITADTLSRAPVQPDDDEDRTMEEENNLLVNQAIYSSFRDSETAREDDKNCRKITFVSRSYITAEMGGQRLAQVRATSSWTGQRGTTPVSRTISSVAQDSSFLRS